MYNYGVSAADARRPEPVREVETKFDIAPDFVLPALDQLGHQINVDTVALHSTYWDTPAGDLLRYRLTLRRRVGDADSGWQLKLPGSGFRTELHWPLTDGAGDQPPAAMTELLAPFLQGSTAAPAVRLEVTRTRHRVVDAAGELLIEIAEDDVRAAPLSAEVRAPRWHEVEAELGPAGDHDLLAAAERALHQAGAYPSTSRAKLSRALLGIGNEGVGTPHASAGAVLANYISQQCDALVAGYFAVVADAPDSVHRTRVATRRIRSTLRTFDRCFSPEAAAALDIELKWYAEVLGEVRDREVLRERIAAAIADLPPELIVGSAPDNIDARLAAEQAERRAELLEAMQTHRYWDLLTAVTGCRDDPPFTAAAGRPARTLTEALQRAERRLDRRLDRAAAPTSTDEELHSARKQGKRVRYAAEAALAGPSRAARRARQLQELLGEFQDNVVAEQVLRRLAADAWSRGEDAFTYGVLAAEAHSRAHQLRAATRDPGGGGRTLRG